MGGSARRQSGPSANFVNLACGSVKGVGGSVKVVRVSVKGMCGSVKGMRGPRMCGPRWVVVIEVDLIDVVAALQDVVQRDPAHVLPAGRGSITLSLRK